MIDKELFLCRVCGLEQGDPPWGEDGKTASFFICHCCGVEFGYEDVAPISIKKYRERWLSQGAPWFWPKDKPEPGGFRRTVTANTYRFSVNCYSEYETMF